MLSTALAAFVGIVCFSGLHVDAEPVFRLFAPATIQVGVEEMFVLSSYIKYCPEDFSACPACYWTIFAQVNKQAHCLKTRRPTQQGCFNGKRNEEFRIYEPGVHVAKIFMVPYLRCINIPAANLTQRVGEVDVGKVIVGDVYGPPDITRITDVTQTSAVVVWTRPARKGSGDALSFIIEFGSSGEKVRTLRVGAERDKVQLTGLKSGRAYFVNIRTENVVGTGEPSAIITFSTKDATENPSDSTKLALFVVVGVLCVLIFLLLLAIALHFYCRRRKRDSSNHEGVENNGSHSKKKFVLPLVGKQRETSKKDPTNQKARTSIPFSEEPPPRPPKNVGKSGHSGKVPTAAKDLRAKSVPDGRTVVHFSRSRAQSEDLESRNESKPDNIMTGRPLPLSPAKLEKFEARRTDDEKRGKSDTKQATPQQTKLENFEVRRTNDEKRGKPNAKQVTPQPAKRILNNEKQKNPANGPSTQPAQVRKPAPLPKPKITADPKEEGRRLSAAPPAGDDRRLSPVSPVPSARRLSAPEPGNAMTSIKSSEVKFGNAMLDEDLYYVELVDT